jgi:hypothetical protein
VVDETGTAICTVLDADVTNVAVSIRHFMVSAAGCEPALLFV